ncbi:receiver/sensor box histidine kinase [Natronomonas moolapensis 8.8.11]|uniref:histidine kinase n=1 Tax=Natronomonas moolapensis (strain DSM 18674 / CECT 7526 / JCM 14361 / 8.8.11) TaxID=268739 RepID=M1XT75_NATM8|nr:PAS domain S-box protein [Natronomonas moolapensis]CCQ37631.1 receiver/sensor box histidine kinase [Natronomonas moolapensis 8.8.11]
MTDASESIRVLHVDDEPGFAAVAADCLQRESGRLAVETAEGTDEGITHLRDHRVDCIVSDYDMPGEDGIEFLERVRGVDPDLPFVLFTGKGSEEIASDAISAGVTEYLQKETGTGQYAVLANRIENAVEQYRTKHEIEASQKRLSLFIEQSPLGVLEYNEDFEIVRLNERGEEILGYAEAELQGHTWQKLVTEDSHEDVAAIADELANAEGGYHSVDENVRKDGETIVCEWHNRVVTDDDGEVVAVFSQFQDVTDRRNREERLRRTTARLEALFENSPDGINVHDAEGTIVDVNPQLCEQTGYGESELVGMKVWDVDARADPEGATGVWAGMSVGDRHETETRYRRADGTTFPVEVHVRRLSIDGEERFVAISRDITERRQREAERERVETSRREIHRITASADVDADARIERLLDVGRDTLGVANAHVAEVDCDANRHEVTVASGSGLAEAGAERALSETFCAATVETEGVLDVSATELPDDSDHRSGLEQWGIGYYVGAKLVVDGELFGTVCFVDRDPHERSLTEDERALVELLAQCVSHVIERAADRRERDAILDRVTDAVVAVDDGWYVQYANERGWAFLRGAGDAGEEAGGGAEHGNGTGDEVRGVCLWEALPEAAGTGFRAACLDAMSEQRPASFRGYYPPRERWLDVRAYPSETGVSVYIRDETTERRREEQIVERQRTIREIYEAISDADTPFERTVEHLIDIGRRVVGTEYGSLSRVEGEEYIFEVVRGGNEDGHEDEDGNEDGHEDEDGNEDGHEDEDGNEDGHEDEDGNGDGHEDEDGNEDGDGGIEPGGVVDLGATNCERTVRNRRSVVLADIAADAPELTDRAGYTEWGVSCYIGTPVIVEDSVYGTFCFYDTERREEPFSEWEVAVVDLMGKWIGYELRRRRTETRLRRQNERLEEFASVVSHDLRNPLGVAAGNLELAREECNSDRLDAVGDAIDRMETLIENLLALAREGEAVSEREPVDLAAAARRHWKRVETADARLVVDVDRRVGADPSRLAQLFENLFRNAVEHGGPEVTVRIGDLDGGFFVADDGPGVPEADRKRVFEAGYSDADGTGFGLAIVERIVAAHGWAVSVGVSETGGARFEITGIDEAVTADGGAERETDAGADAEGGSDTELDSSSDAGADDDPNAGSTL